MRLYCQANSTCGTATLVRELASSLTGRTGITPLTLSLLTDPGVLDRPKRVGIHSFSRSVTTDQCLLYSAGNASWLIGKL